jgi:hypothetical protein
MIITNILPLEKGLLYITMGEANTADCTSSKKSQSIKLILIKARMFAGYTVQKKSTAAQGLPICHR